MHKHYTNRTLDAATIDKINGSRVEVSDYEGWGNNRPIHPDVVAAGLKPGDRMTFETRGSFVTGWLFLGQWHGRKSDEELALEAKVSKARRDLESAERALENLDSNIEEENALPFWLQQRLRKFHEEGGIEFIAGGGWGYELAICQLAQVFADNELNEDDPALKEIDEKYGCSGNQWSMAKALAKAHLDGEDLYGTIGGLSPITGDAYYTKG